MTRLKHILFGLTFGFAVALVPAMAEETQQSISADDVTDQQLEQFADALSDVRELGSQYSTEISAAESQEEAQELQREAQTEMVAAVEEAGLSVREYNTIAELMSQNPDLMERVETMLES